jgi:hypothetical protein
MPKTSTMPVNLSRFKQRLERFHGVASHYLPNYLGWRRAFE